MSSSPSDAEILSFDFSPFGTTDLFTHCVSTEIQQYQRDREQFIAAVTIESLNDEVLMVHHDVSVDANISDYLVRGQWFEEEAVFGMAEHIEFVLESNGIRPCDVEDAECDSLRHRMSFIDIGANLGIYTVALAAHFRLKYPFFDLHAFEPLDANYMLLSSSIRLNQLDNVYLFPYGLAEGGHIGDRTSFVIDAENKGHSHSHRPRL